MNDLPEITPPPPEEIQGMMDELFPGLAAPVIEEAAGHLCNRILIDHFRARGIPMNYHRATIALENAVREGRLICMGKCYDPVNHRMVMGFKPVEPGVSAETVKCPKK